MLENSYIHSKISSDEDLETLDRKVSEDLEMLNIKKILSQYTIKQFKSGAYAGAWYTKIDGKKYQRTSREELELFIVQYHKNKKRADAITLERFADEYLSSRKNTVALSTWKKDCSMYETYIKTSEMAKKPVSDITIRDANDFWNHCKSLHPKMKKRYWDNIITTVNGLMQYIKMSGHYFNNPFEVFKPHRDLFEKAKKKGEADVFSGEEEKRICQIARKDAEDKGCVEAMGIILLFKTGLRVGEICALKWDDREEIDGKKYLHVQREMAEHVEEDTRKTTGYDLLDHCKSDAGDRLIPITGEIERLLNEILEMSEKNDFSTDMDDFIFHRRRNGVVSASNRSGFNARIRKYCRKADMKEIKSLHDIRRTFITNLYNSGCPLKTVQMIAGHSSETMTLKYLRRKSDDNALDYMEKMSDKKTE